jgi:hypothetical protein
MLASEVEHQTTVADSLRLFLAAIPTMFQRRRAHGLEVLACLVS